MTGIRKERNTFYITHSGELLVWLIVILVIVALSTFFIFKNAKEDNDYSIFMPDVDGLIVGSPVRMMGIEVGHVTKIKPTNEEVYIKFIITNKTIQIPQGTRATVEFSGMAGSKSLELYLPDKNSYVDNSTPILTVDPPKRLHDAMGLLNDMFDKLGSIINTSSAFTKKIEYLDIQMPSGGENPETFVKYADGLVDKQTKRVDDLGVKLEKYKNKTGELPNVGKK